ncbi:MAG: leucyl aminopeptidase family protein, partial [Thermomicrobium sp.]
MGIEVTTSSEPLNRLTGSVVIPIVPEGEVEGSLEFLEAPLRVWIGRSARAVGVTGRVGQGAVLPPCEGMAAERLIAVGLGRSTQRTLSDIRKAAAIAVKLAAEAGERSLVWPLVPAPSVKDETVAQVLVEGTVLASYRFSRYRSTEDGARIERLTIIGGADVDTGIRYGRLVSDAVVFARDLTNEPGNILDPERLSGIAWEMAQEVGLECAIYDRALLEELGAGAILAVGQGSRREPRLVHLIYRPEGEARGRLALIGKGVTFDSGGLSLKPAEGMERMKGDMAGGAAVLAVLRALPGLGLPLEVHGVVVAAENLPDGNAFRPGDILRTLSGKTVEVISTDAEG